MASISPVEAPGKKRLLRELKELVKNMPPLGEEADRFGQDLREIRKCQPSIRGNIKALFEGRKGKRIGNGRDLEAFSKAHGLHR